MGRQLTVVEVGPRDGLQNETVYIPTEIKVALIGALSEAGFPVIECTSFVSPRAVPQLADADEVMRRIRRRPGVRHLALVPNRQGLERALAASCDAIALFVAATEEFSQANLRASIADALARAADVAIEAKRVGCWMRGYISVAFHCPFAGPVAPEQVVEVATQLFALGCDELVVADTIGRASPDEVRRLLEELSRLVPSDHLAVHFHDTYGRALENVAVALEYGVGTIDAALSGLGGCPFAPGAPGNLATERLLDFLEPRGLALSIDRHQLERARALLAAYIPRLNGSS